MFGNIRFAVRTLRNNRGIYLFAIMVLALGCGIGTAIFSLVEAVLLTPLPFPDQNSLIVIWKADPAAAVPFIELAYPELADIIENVPALESAALMPSTLYGYGKVLEVSGSAPVQLESTPVSHDFFRTLGVSPSRGRDFAPSDEGLGAAPVAILNNRVWREQFHAAKNIVGAQIRLNGTGYSVIGVMPAAVDFPKGAGVWLPLGVNSARADRQVSYLQAIARIRRGYSLAQVTARLDSLFQRLAQQYPQANSRVQQAVVTTLPRYLTGSSRVQLLLSLTAAFLLLSAGSVTAGNLLLSRAFRRRSEMATRIALGASSRQIAIQFLWEGAVAGLMALAGALVLAWSLVRLLLRWAPSDIPGIELAHLDPAAFAFAAVVAVFCTLACSLAPALMATRFGLEGLLREGSGKLTAARSVRRMQGAFTVIQTAITVVLLTLSLLAVASVRAMLHTDTGFSNRQAVTVNLPLKGLERQRRSQIYARLIDRLRSSPLVSSAGGVLLRPLEGTVGWEMRYQVEFAATPVSSELPIAELEVVTPGYFQTLGTPLLRGRDFSAQDAETFEPTAIVSRAFAERLERMGRDPLRTRIRLGPGSASPWRQIVGVIADMRDRDVTSSRPGIYLNFLQTSIPVTYLAVSGRGTGPELTALVRRELALIDSTQAVANVATIGDLIDRNTARPRFNMALLFIFGAGALLLAAAGIYSVVAESVSLRRKEIAVRLALGARRTVLMRHLIGVPVRLVLVGEAVGVVTAIAVGSAVRPMLYSVSPNDPLLLGSVLVFLAAVSVVAAATPAWAASGEDPYPMLHAD